MALSELVNENGIDLDEALWMTDFLMHENDRKNTLEKIDWKQINSYHSSNS